ncbi:MAG: hypothetical protein D3923_02945 [Candidatus Electrothrix sp. AR3]|nr:hypothetical protein [Candidatus Electrothrix sp. AR3]
MRYKTKIAPLTLSLLATCSINAFAQNSGRRVPPPEAFTACEGKRAGDRAKFTFRQGQSVTGICEEREGRLILRPDHFRRQGGDRPSGAYTACENKQAGETAQLITPDGRTVNGICEQDGDRLFLRPNRSGSDQQPYKQQPEGRSDSGQQPYEQQPKDRSGSGQQPYKQQPEDRSDSGQQPYKQQQPKDRQAKNLLKYKVCEGKQAGDTARLITPDGQTINGTCERDGDQLILRPHKKNKKVLPEGRQQNNLEGFRMKLKKCLRNILDLI